MMTASEAAASITSDSVIPPGAAWITSTTIRSCGSLAISSWSASSEPDTSALSTTASSLTSPSVAFEKTSSRLTLRACWRASDSALRRWLRCCASWRARRSFSTTSNRSPASDTSSIPRISAGSPGPADSVRAPVKSSIARTLPHVDPATTESPTVMVPRWTSTVATGPRPGSR